MKPITDCAGKVLAYENNVSEYRKEIRSRSNGLLAYFNPVSIGLGRAASEFGIRLSP